MHEAVQGRVFVDKGVSKGQKVPSRRHSLEAKDTEIELAPDAWERFEAAVDKVVKPPHPSERLTQNKPSIKR